MRDALAAAAGHEAVIVSHQLPIWMARCDAEGRRLFHDPRKRECTLASVTSFTYVDGRVDLGRLPRARGRAAQAAPGPEVRRGGLGSRCGERVWPAVWRPARCWRSCCSPAAAWPTPTTRTRPGDSRATPMSAGTLTLIPPDGPPAAGRDHRTGPGRRRHPVQQGVPGQGGGDQRLGLLVPAVPQGGARPAGGQRGDRRRRPVPRHHQQGPAAGRGRGGSSRENKITYPSIYDPDRPDPADVLPGVLPPSAIPSTMILDREGRLAVRVLGPISKITLVQMINDTANGK